MDYTALTDEQLAEACKSHDELAFQELAKRYVRPIFGFVRQYAKEDDAEDIAQDTFFKVWKKIKQYRKGLRFKPWLYTVARNTALDHIKKKRAATFSELDDSENDLSFADTVEDPLPLPDEAFAKAALAADIQDVVLQLHPNHQSVLTLHYREEMTFDEIAEVLGKPMNTVKSWHRRALIKLRELLKSAPRYKDLS